MSSPTVYDNNDPLIGSSYCLQQAEEIADSIISLPLSEVHTIDEIESVAKLVNQFYQS